MVASLSSDALVDVFWDSVVTYLYAAVFVLCVCVCVCICVREQGVVKIIANNDYKHLKSFRSFYDRYESIDRFDDGGEHRVSGSTNDFFSLRTHEEEMEYARFSDALNAGMLRRSSSREKEEDGEMSTAAEIVRDPSVARRPRPHEANLLTSRHLVRDLSSKSGLVRASSSSMNTRRQHAGGTRKPLSATTVPSDRYQSDLSATSANLNNAKRVADEALSMVATVQERQQQFERKFLVLLKTEGESRRMNILELWSKVKEMLDATPASSATDDMVGNKENSQPGGQRQAHIDGSASAAACGASNGVEYYIEQVAGSLRGSISAIDAKCERLRSAVTAVRRTALLADAKCGAVAAEFVKLYRQVDLPVTTSTTLPPPALGGEYDGSERAEEHETASLVPRPRSKHVMPSSGVTSTRKKLGTKSSKKKKTSAFVR